MCNTCDELLHYVLSLLGHVHDHICVHVHLHAWFVHVHVASCLVCMTMGIHGIFATVARLCMNSVAWKFVSQRTRHWRLGGDWG